MLRFSTVVFLDGDGFDEFLDAANFAVGDTSGYLYPGPYVGCAEWVAAAYEYLMAWEYGESGETTDGTPWGGGDRVVVFTADGDHQDTMTTVPVGGYVMTWHTGLASAGLYRRDA